MADFAGPHGFGQNCRTDDYYCDRALMATLLELLALGQLTLYESSNFRLADLTYPSTSQVKIQIKDMLQCIHKDACYTMTSRAVTLLTTSCTGK